MKKGIGKALETGMGPFRFLHEEVPEKDVSVLSNLGRLSILFYLLNRPCAPISSISRDLERSEGSVRWHIGILKGAGIVESMDGRNFVKGSLLPDDVGMFIVLNGDIANRIADLIIHRGPLEMGDLRRALKISSQRLRYHIKRLEKVGFLKKSGEVYELAFDLMEFQREYGKMMERVLAKIAMDARSEGVNMEILRKGHGFIIKVLSPVEAEFEVGEVPFHDVLG